MNFSEGLSYFVGIRGDIIFRLSNQLYIGIGANEPTSCHAFSFVLEIEKYESGRKKGKWEVSFKVHRSFPDILNPSHALISIWSFKYI